MSQQLCYAFKNGKKGYIQRAIEHLKNDSSLDWTSFLNESITLVPVPRSSPLQEGALWPAKEIASCLLEEGLAKEVVTLIKRESAIRKSAIQSNANSRPSVDDNYNSLSVSTELLMPTKITLVDDVLTLGRTGVACASKLSEAFPDAEIRFFSIVRTQSFVENIEKLIDVSIGNIHFNPNSGKTSREP